MVVYFPTQEQALDVSKVIENECIFGLVTVFTTETIPRMGVSLTLGIVSDW